MTRWHSIALAVAVAIPTLASAQSLTTPSDWRWKADGPARVVAEEALSDSAWRFAWMPPGWHVTTRPGVVLFNPAHRASGRYELASEIVLFSNASDQGFGIFLGGSGLDSPNAAYTAVLLRPDGTVSIQEKCGATMATRAPWTPAPAAKAQSGAEAATYALRVSVEPDSIRVYVNGARALTRASAGLQTNGTFGFRVGGDTNLHIMSLDHTQKLAPRAPASQQVAASDHWLRLGSAARALGAAQMVWCE
jgi:hypothetical protein